MPLSTRIYMAQKLLEDPPSQPEMVLRGGSAHPTQAILAGFCEDPRVKYKVLSKL